MWYGIIQICLSTKKHDRLISKPITDSVRIFNKVTPFKFMVCHAALEVFRELTKLNYLPSKQLIDCFVNSQLAFPVHGITSYPNAQISLNYKHLYACQSICL